MAEGYKKNIVEHLKKAITKGYKVNSLKWALINQGYSEVIVDKALKQAEKELVEEESKKEKEIQKEKPKITYQLYDERNRPIGKRPFWKKLLRFK